MSKKELDFAVFCIENIAEFFNRNGADVYRMLDESGILDGYIIKSYDVLHTLGKEYIVSDIADYMEEAGLEL